MSTIVIRTLLISLGITAALGAWLNFYILRKLWLVIIKQDVRIAAIGKLVEGLNTPKAPDGAQEHQKAIETLQKIGSGDLEEQRHALRLLSMIKTES